jgi:hypothetical protein
MPNPIFSIDFNKQAIQIFLAAMVVVIWFFLLPIFLFTTPELEGLFLFSMLTPFPYLLILFLWFAPSFYLLKLFDWHFPGISLGLTFLSGIPSLMLIGFVIPSPGDLGNLRDLPFWISGICMLVVLLFTHKIPQPSDAK